MIRERRSKEKLEQYYRKFIEEGVLDVNVHPWVAQSWQESSSQGISRQELTLSTRLTSSELTQRRLRHQEALHYLEALYLEIREYFTEHNLSLLLLDEECYALQNYAMPFYQKTAGELDGARLTEADIGASSTGITFRQQAAFWLFGPEMWVEECRSGDACSAPVMLAGRLKFILTIVGVEQDEQPFDAMVALLLTMKSAMESHLGVLSKLQVQQTMLNAAPVAAYHILPGGEVAYANRLGYSRLGEQPDSILPANLNNVLLNYRHTPVYKGFFGVAAHNREITWITPQKTYEDLVNVEPLLARDGTVESVVAVALPIEELQTLMGHTAGYTARYSLASMVGKLPVFTAMMEKAMRAARQQNNVLLQGEAGIGKQRLAHGIHQASSRAAGPLLVAKCDSAAEMLTEELFGGSSSAAAVSGKLELARGGTLFLDEVEKLPGEIQEKLLMVLRSLMSAVEQSKGRNDTVRVIAACDGDLRRLTEKRAFLPELYDLLAKTVIRVPSLRSRREDLPLLSEHIVTELAVLHGMTAKNLAPEAQERIAAYDWPGNIKQLQGVIERAFFQAEGEEIVAADIQLPGEGSIGSEWKDNREIFVTAWKAAGGNISRLAHVLDVSRVTLYRYLKKYGMEK